MVVNKKERQENILLDKADSASKSKLNYLLIMPRLVQNYGDGYIFTLGIAYVSSSMKKNGYNVVTLNLNHFSGDDFSVIKSTIEKNDIHVVATGGLSPQFHIVQSVIKSAKLVNRNIVTIVGGGIISADPETAMRALQYADFGVLGEGEITMNEWASTLEKGGDFSSVEGIIYKDGAVYRITKKRDEIKNLDSIPWPDFDGFNIDKYLEAPPANFAGLSNKRMICMVGSRACPYKCTFCFHTNGSTYRQRSWDDFFGELDSLVSRYKIEYLYMVDELFAVDKDRVKEFCSRIKKYNIHWFSSFRINMVDQELLKILKGSGLDVMFFGLESADNKILKSMRKGITIEKTEKVLKLVSESEIDLYGCFIFGDIEETSETVNNTLNWWEAHPQYNIHLTLIKPFPGSHIYQYACEKGIIKDKVKYLKDGCPQVNISKMTDAEFLKLGNYLSEAQSFTNSIESLKLEWSDSKLGRITISGLCSGCQNNDTWENIKLFANDYICCSNCGQKYDIPCPDILRENIDKNISILLQKFHKVAVWGMTLTIMDLFGKSKILNGPNIFPIDISESKTQMARNSKAIYSPSILEQEEIEIVIIAVPPSGRQITCQINENHKIVKKIIDICWLIDSNSILEKL
jgi:anaerobic magnesium-protoporphyrin IX monomethyl ester cyclase